MGVPTGYFLAAQAAAESAEAAAQILADTRAVINHIPVAAEQAPRIVAEIEVLRDEPPRVLRRLLFPREWRHDEYG